MKVAEYINPVKHVAHPLVIGLRGLPGAGKTSLSLELAMSGLFDQHSMATPMRRAMQDIGVSKASHPAVYREWLQKIGQQMRDLDSDHWVKMAKPSLDRTLDRGRHAIIDDIRYPNEAALCDLVFFITPDGFDLLDLGTFANHKSEDWNLAFTRNPAAQLDGKTFPITNPFGRIKDTAGAVANLIDKSVILRRSSCNSPITSKPPTEPSPLTANLPSSTSPPNTSTSSTPSSDSAPNPASSSTP